MRICKKHQSSHYSFDTCPWCVVAEQDVRIRELEAVLKELRIRLHAAGRRPEECHEMSMIDDALRGEENHDQDR